MTEVRKPTFNLTPKRLQALRLIQKHPDCYVGHVAQEVLAGEYRGKRGLWAQQATRMGAGYCQKLQEAGLVRINTYTQFGYGTVHLTKLGEDTLRESDTLEAAVARSIE